LAAKTKSEGTGLPKNTAAALSYLLGWITGIAFLLIEKDSFVRFHAMQSTITFGSLTIITLIPFVGWILSPIAMMVGFILWLVLMYQAYQGKELELPVVGKLARQALGKMK